MCFPMRYLSDLKRLRSPCNRSGCRLQIFSVGDGSSRRMPACLFQSDEYKKCISCQRRLRRPDRMPGELADLIENRGRALKKEGFSLARRRAFMSITSAPAPPAIGTDL